MASLRTVGLVKTYGNVYALRDVSLDVAEGELVAVLGPSGSGKSTFVRAVAGFVKVDSGAIHLGDRDVTRVPPEKRNTAMVFQNYALWPHMTVAQNIAYGLRIRRWTEDAIRRKVAWALELVDLVGLENRLPSQLSGGQQQRVALARALVVDPDVLLLDEPLSNLDAKIRYRIRFEIKKLQKQLKLTTIYITHDQEEALSIADKVAILDRGQLLQYGAPQEVYARPANAFVAEFIGASTVVRVPVRRDAQGSFIDLGGARIPAPAKAEGEEAMVIFRADEMELEPEQGAGAGGTGAGATSAGVPGAAATAAAGVYVPAAAGAATPDAGGTDGPGGDGTGFYVFRGTVVESMYLGARVRYEVRVGDQATFFVDSQRAIPPGQPVSLRIDREKLYVF